MTEAHPIATPTRLTDAQLRTLEDAILRSRDATAFAKRVIIWLLRKTGGLTRRVALSLPESFGGNHGTAKEVQHGAHDMVSTNGTTHLDQLLERLGTRMRLEHHQGMLVHCEFHSDPLDPLSGGRTIWWSDVWYDRNADAIPPPELDDLLAIEIPA